MARKIEGTAKAQKAMRTYRKKHRWNPLTETYNEWEKRMKSIYKSFVELFTGDWRNP